MVLISFGCLGYTTFTITIHLVPHMTDLGISADIATAVLSLTGVVQSLGGILFGIVIDKMGSRRMLAICFIIVAVSLYWLVPITTLVMFFLFAVVYSFGIGGGTAVESTMTAELFGLKAHGLILGVISFGFTIGAAIGPVVTGYLFDLTGNYQIAFIACASVGVLGFVLTLLIKSIKKTA
jgi:MFS family permease